MLVTDTFCVLTSVIKALGSHNFGFTLQEIEFLEIGFLGVCPT